VDYNSTLDPSVKKIMHHTQEHNHFHVAPALSGHLNP
jgi:hypothetical protein